MMVTPLLSPKLDVVFKILFVAEPALLVALLNTILPLDGYATAQALVINNPDIDREAIHTKQIVLDIRAVDTTGRQFNVELQVQRERAYVNRAIHYLSRLHGDQLSVSQDYDQINPTLGIHLLDFVLADDTSIWHHARRLAFRASYPSGKPPFGSACAVSSSASVCVPPGD